MNLGVSFIFLSFLTCLKIVSCQCFDNSTVTVRIGCFQCEKYFPDLSCTVGGLNYNKNFFLEIVDFGETETEEYDVKNIQKRILNGNIDLVLFKNEHLYYLTDYLHTFKLSEFEERDVVENYYSAIIDPLKDKNETDSYYGIPYISDRTVIWYREDLQRKYNFVSPPWTINQLDGILRQVSDNSSGWNSDYACLGFRAVLNEDLTGFFAELLKISNASIIYDSEEEEVYIENKQDLIEVLSIVTGWIDDRIVFSEQLEKSEDDINIKWRFLELGFFRGNFSWYKNFVGSVVGEEMKPGWVDGISVNNQLNFGISKYTNKTREFLINVTNSIIGFEVDDDYSLMRQNFDDFTTSAMIDDSQSFDQYCKYICPSEGEKITNKPHIDKSVYLTLSMYLQTALKSILDSGFIEETLDDLENDLKLVFMEGNVSRQYEYYFFWFIPVVVISATIIILFPLISCGWKIIESIKGLYTRQRLLKFHIENQETSKQVWEYFKLSLRTVLIFCFIVFLFASVGAVFLLTTLNTESAIDTLETAWKSQVLLRINDALKLVFSDYETEVAENIAKTKLFNLLNTIKVSSNTIKFVVNNESTIIASDHPLLKRESSLDSSGHYLATDFSSWVTKNYGNLSSLNFPTYTEISVGEDIEKYTFSTGNIEIWVDGMKYIDEDIDWDIIILTPSKDLLAYVTLGNLFSVIATLLIVIFSLSVAISLVLFITQSLKSLANLMRRVEGLDLDVEALKKKSFFTEIASIQERFLELLETLKEYKKYLPANLNLFNMDDDLDDEDDESNLSILSQSLGLGKMKDLEALDMKSVRVDNKVQNLAIKQQLQQKSFNKKDISVILIKLQNFDEFVQNVVPDDFIEIHTKYIELVNSRVIQFSGTFSTFQGSEICASYNTSRSHAHHEKAACQTALKVMKDLKKLNQKLVDFDYPPFIVSISVVSGSAFCGNLGTDSIRSYSVIGNILSECYVMEKLNFDYKTNIMVNRECFENLEEDFEFWPIEIVSFDNGKTKSPLFELIGKKKIEEKEADKICANAINEFLNYDYIESRKLMDSLRFKKFERKTHHNRFVELLMKLSLEQKRTGGAEYCLKINKKSVFVQKAKNVGLGGVRKAGLPSIL